MTMQARNSARTTRAPLPHRVDAANSGNTRRAESDGRWPAIVEALTSLRDTDRHSVRIVDADCGAGALLIHAAEQARALGFTAIEGRGIDGAPVLVARARSSAARLHDAAIGLSFEAVDVLSALEEEAEFPADILLWSGRPAGFDERRVQRAMSKAANLVLVDKPRRSRSASEAKA